MTYVIIFKKYFLRYDCLQLNYPPCRITLDRAELIALLLIRSSSDRSQQTFIVAAFPGSAKSHVSEQ